MAAGQAKKGGEMGVNGAWYEGGQFLPSSENTIQGLQAHKDYPRAGGRKLIAPYVWGTAPADGMLSIFDRIEHFCLDNRKACQYVKGQGFQGLQLEPYDRLMTDCYNRPFLPEHKAWITSMAERWNRGERWIPLAEDPYHYLNNQ